MLAPGLAGIQMLVRSRNLENSNQQTVAEYREQSTAQRQNMLGELRTLSDNYTTANDQLQKSIGEDAIDNMLFLNAIR